jgi:uncharacterized protein (DUF58 family)
VTDPHVRLRPTSMGLVYAFAIVAVLVAATNHANNLAYLMGFLMFSLWAWGTAEGWARIAALRAEIRAPAPVFAGGAARVHVTVDSVSGRLPPLAVRVMLLGEDGAVLGESLLESTGGLPARTAVEVLCPRRGMVRVAAVVLSTTEPLGLVRASASTAPRKTSSRSCGATSRATLRAASTGRSPPGATR